MTNVTIAIRGPSPHLRRPITTPGDGMTLLSCPTIAIGDIHIFSIVRAQLRRRASGLGIGHLGEVLGLPTERSRSEAGSRRVHSSRILAPGR